MEQILSKVNGLSELLVTLTKKVDKMEERQLLILKAIGKLPKKKGRTTHICQNLGCVRSGKKFEEVTLHKTRILCVENDPLHEVIKKLPQHYDFFLNNFLKASKNKSFYRQCKQHSYVYSAKIGWEEVRASYLIARLERITLNAFAKYMKKLRSEIPKKAFAMKIKKRVFLNKLKFHKDSLRESKCPSPKVLEYSASAPPQT